MSSFLYFICIRHKWLIYVILCGYAYGINIINMIIRYDPIPHEYHFLTDFTILLNPSFILSIWLDMAMTFRFIDYQLYFADDVEIFVLFSVANLIFWMPIAFTIQMYAIRKYRKRNSKELVSMSIPGKAIRIVAIAVIGLTYIWFIWYS